MSAYVVDKVHIDALISAVVNGTSDGEREVTGSIFYWYHADPDGDLVQYRLDYASEDMIGRILIDANVESVCYRYSEQPTDDLPGPVDKYWLRPYTAARTRRLTVVEALKALDGYEYQSCEHPGWESSVAYGFVVRMRSWLIGRLPGYDAADTWSVAA